MRNKSARIFGAALLLSLATGRAAADATTLSTGDDSVNATGSDAMLEFPVTRGGDLN